MLWTVPLSIIRSFSLNTQQWYMSYRSADNWPKHVEFYSKNKFEKLVHLVGFLIRIYHDTRSPECQTSQSLSKEIFQLSLPCSHELTNGPHLKEAKFFPQPIYIKTHFHTYDPNYA